MQEALAQFAGSDQIAAKLHMYLRFRGVKPFISGNASHKSARKPQLFGDDPGLGKTATFQSIVEYFLTRLRTVFAGVATTPSLLKNSKVNPLYALFFAAGNPKGATTAVKIANDILRKFNHG